MLCPFGGADYILRCEGLHIRLTWLLRRIPWTQTLLKNGMEHWYGGATLYSCAAIHSAAQV
ncbi:hypothetical protein GCM10007421_36410 [Halopseudomonas oceani]|nr:hypothetical protein GCM10007421_36410 [Halopseudomonas oceani]